MSSRRRLTRSLLTGIAVVFPLALLALLVWQFGGLLWVVATGLASVPVDMLGVEGSLATAAVLLASLGLVLAVLVAIGELARHRLGGATVDLVDDLVERVPGLGPIYREMRRSRSIIAPEGGGRFTEVVLVELSPDVQVLGFVVGPTSDEITRQTDNDRRTVYLPLAPNPSVGGHLVHVPSTVLTETDLGVRQALGIVFTLDAGDPEPTAAPFEEVFHAVEH